MSQNCPILERITTVDETDFSRDDWLIVRCRETGFVFLANPPEYSQLETEYAWEQTSLKETERRAIEEPVMSRVSTIAKQTKMTLFPKRNKIATVACGLLRTRQPSETLAVLDVGCGAGVLMAEVHRRLASVGRKVTPIGIEVSRQLASASHRQVAPLGGRVVCANALDGLAELPSGSIHLAMMCSFLEHECQPLRMLQRLYAVLVPGGSVVLKVPNFACWNRMLRGRKWCGFRFPDHVNYFTPKTLHTLAQEAGFERTQQNMLDKFPLSDNMYAVLTKSA